MSTAATPTKGEASVGAAAASSSSPTKADLELLKDERAKIRSKLYAEYGPRIEAMIIDANQSTMHLSPAEEREQRLQSMLSDRTPLRQQVKSAQHEAIARLIEEAKESHGRGVDVASRLDMLLKLQEGK